MARYTTIHLYNVTAGRDEAYAQWFDGLHRGAVSRVAGFLSTDRYEITPEQVMPDIPQPWRFASIYDFEYTDLATQLPPLGQEIALARDAGLIATDDTERLYSYRLHGDWAGSANWRSDAPLSGISFILGNYTPGRYDDYIRWYEEVHGPEVANVPGHVAVRRGIISEIQLEPQRHCLGEVLVMTAQQTDDLGFTIGDFIARAVGNSPSGIAMQPRSTAGSLARTVHYFRKISGHQFWPGGIAYAGDLAAYPGRA